MSVKQWVSNLKGLDALREQESAMPTPGKGEVLVEIRAVSLNFRDTEGSWLALIRRRKLCYTHHIPWNSLHG